MLRKLLGDAMAGGASDLFFSSGDKPAVRIDGELVFKSFRLSEPQVSEQLQGVVSAEQWAMVSNGIEVDFSFILEGIGRFRGNIYRHERGVGAAFRPIFPEIRTLDQLGVPGVAEDILESRTGLALVTGPVGQGKSATLAAMIDYLNVHHALHIVTLEDPIEAIHESKRSLMTQREIGRHSLTFASGLRAALRECPDVLMLGEIRDLESFRLAITAAETGIFVLATMHSPSAPMAIDRIIDVFPESEKHTVRALLSQSLNSVISQRLMKVSEGPGRVAAHEVMIATPGVRSQIREGHTAQLNMSIQTGSEYGMQTMDQCLLGLVRSGAVTREVAKQHAMTPGNF